LHRWQRLRRRRLICRRRRSAAAVPRRRLDLRPAERARGVRGQPHVDALHVVQVLARRQPPHRLAALHRAEAHRALAAAAVPRRPRVRELRDLGRHVSDATQYVVLSPAGAAGALGGYDWRTPPDVAVAVEDDDGDERDAREADAGVAEDGRPFANGLVLLRHRRRHTHRRRAGTRTHGDGDGDGNGGDLSFVRGGMSRGIG
ncbi:Os06g0539801, partial [Oryza sativa Japonica Group]